MAVILSCAAFSLRPPPAAAQPVTGEEVRLAVKAAVAFLQRQQQPDGNWPQYRMQGGTTALATLALLNAGVPVTDDAMQRALEAVRRIPLESTYVVALKIQALAAADPKRYKNEIAAAARWLALSQNASGMWSYGVIEGRGDFSNSQFALLGLHEASRAGADVPDPVWRAAEAVFVQAQLRDGSWSYVPNSGRGGTGTGSMTAAGLASLYITGNSLEASRERGFTDDGAAPRCGKYSEFRPLARGIDWLAQNFSARSNPPHGGWFYYYLYGVERVGILSGMRFFGKHDWYRAGAAQLVRLQNGDGSWREQDPVVDTSFALLFLAKGHRPVLFHKLQWSRDHNWNLDRGDLAHLVEFLGDRLGEPVSWNVVSLEQDVEDWLAAPILYFNGHVFPTLADKDVEKLRDFVERGGTILAEACCGRDEFRRGFQAFAQRAFPEFATLRLPPTHPVFRSLFKLDGDTFELHGLDVGCRTSVFYSPNDLSCLWEQINVPGKSEPAFQLGANIAAYVTGRQPLPDKLAVAQLVKRPGPDSTDAATLSRAAVHLAQLMHNGDWRPDPKAVPSLADHLYESLGVDVVRGYTPLRATDPRLARYPILYMTGHFTFTLSDEERDALRKHLERGGFLFAEACCGRRAFDSAFRELAAQLFPDHPLARLGPDHPILAGRPGVPLGKITYKPAVLQERPGLDEPVLEAVTLAGRAVIVYSPYAIGCSLDGHTCFGCRGVTPDDARCIAGNVILHALTY